MQSKIITSSLIALGALLTLSGCGSSDSGTQAVGESPLPPTGEAITVSGQVTDMPIPNATVMVTVDGQTFQAPLATDADGNYEVEIRSSNPAALVLMEAFDPNGVAYFTALSDSFADLQAQSDANGRVSDQDITNVTTAHYVLATRADDDRSIESTTELNDSAALVDANAALQLSAAIKLVVENIDGVTLPDEYADTQELAEAIADGNSTFLADVAPSAMDEAIDRVINDGNATIAWQQDRVPGVYLHREGFSLFAFFADGTGLSASYERDSIVGFQWAVNDAGKLVVVYLNGASDSDVVTLLSHTGNVLSVMVEEHGGDTSRDSPSTVLYFPFADGFTNDNAPGSYSAMDESGQLKVLQEDHTGYNLDLRTGIQSDGFFWEVSSDGTLYLIDDAGGNTSQARILGGAEDGGMHLLVTDMGPDGHADQMRVITVRQVDVVATTPGDVDTPDLTLAGNAYAFIDGHQIDVFQFRADGQVRQVGQHVRANGDVQLVDRHGEWDMVDDQTIRIWLQGQDGTEDARVIAGLGEDEMHVQTEEDMADGTDRVATRIRPIHVDEIRGYYELLDENGSTHGESVELFADFSGHYRVDGVLERAFDWTLDERGSLIICLQSDDSFRAETLTLRLLAGGTPGSAMRLIMERRVNGILEADEQSDRAIRILTVLREG